MVFFESVKLGGVGDELDLEVQVFGQVVFVELDGKLARVVHLLDSFLDLACQEENLSQQHQRLNHQRSLIGPANCLGSRGQILRKLEEFLN